MITCGVELIYVNLIALMYAKPTAHADMAWPPLTYNQSVGDNFSWIAKFRISPQNSK